MIDFTEIKAIGFDLDETLYPSDPQINDRIRNRMSESILIKIPELKSLRGARDHFETRYKELQSGRKVLIEVGYKEAEASRIADEAVSQANIVDLIKKRPSTVRIIRRISGDYCTGLVTSSPEETALRKLEAIGLRPTLFHEKVYGDTPGAGEKQSGQAFRYWLNCLRKYDLPPECCLYVGNSLKSDILPAKSNGMKTIGVWSDIPEADLSINSIDELEALIYG